MWGNTESRSANHTHESYPESCPQTIPPRQTSRTARGILGHTHIYTVQLKFIYMHLFGVFVGHMADPVCLDHPASWGCRSGSRKPWPNAGRSWAFPWRPPWRPDPLKIKAHDIYIHKVEIHLCHLVLLGSILGSISIGTWAFQTATGMAGDVEAEASTGEAPSKWSGGGWGDVRDAVGCGWRPSLCSNWFASW